MPRYGGETDAIHNEDCENQGRQIQNIRTISQDQAKDQPMCKFVQCRQCTMCRYLKAKTKHVKQSILTRSNPGLQVTNSPQSGGRETSTQHWDRSGQETPLRSCHFFGPRHEQSWRGHLFDLCWPLRRAPSSWPLGRALCLRPPCRTGRAHWWSSTAFFLKDQNRHFSMSLH